MHCYIYGTALLVCYIIYLYTLLVCWFVCLFVNPINQTNLPPNISIFVNFENFKKDKKSEKFFSTFGTKRKSLQIEQQSKVKDRIWARSALKAL